ncbi:hypothetical protein CDAR_465461 [Caerostris darwini]|uniref:Uncharacterized protein n=1 Tax=Caerostris darwini TaxID=1538125 RepID=A0AAV4SDH1_9ARAC|nr:hypothetical protein CDAR_465461 [Caerostris darwini]
MRRINKIHVHKYYNRANLFQWKTGLRTPFLSLPIRRRQTKGENLRKRGWRATREPGSGGCGAQNVQVGNPCLQFCQADENNCTAPSTGQ